MDGTLSKSTITMTRITVLATSIKTLSSTKPERESRNLVVQGRVTSREANRSTSGGSATVISIITTPMAMSTTNMG